MDKKTIYQTPIAVLIGIQVANTILSGSNLGADTTKFVEENEEYVL